MSFILLGDIVFVPIDYYIFLGSHMTSLTLNITALVLRSVLLNHFSNSRNVTGVHDHGNCWSHHIPYHTELTDLME